MKDYANYISDQLSYTVDEQYFKDNGYQYQKLFAMEIPYYHKKFEDFHVWCNADTKEVFVDDWYGFLTPMALKFYMAHKDRLKVSTTFDDYEYMDFYLNRKSGEIILDDDVISQYKGDIEGYFNCKYKKSKEWREGVFIRSLSDVMVDEINRLTSNALNK